MTIQVNGNPDQPGTAQSDPNAETTQPEAQAKDGGEMSEQELDSIFGDADEGAENSADEGGLDPEDELTLPDGSTLTIAQIMELAKGVKPKPKFGMEKGPSDEVPEGMNPEVLFLIKEKFNEKFTSLSEKYPHVEKAQLEAIIRSMDNPQFSDIERIMKDIQTKNEKYLEKHVNSFLQHKQKIAGGVTEAESLGAGAIPPTSSPEDVVDLKKPESIEKLFGKLFGK